MNENARKWVGALRSGDYEQTKNFLHDKKGFCCLGVACDLYAKETGKGKWNEDSSIYVFGLRDGTMESTVLPWSVKQWLGLVDCEGRMLRVVESLTAANDEGDGKSFVEISEIIESEPEGLFRE